MRQRLICPMLAAAVLAVAALGGVDRASAAIRITISDGTADKVYYSSSSESALFATDLGALDVVLQATLSNFPGLSTGGVLSQTLILGDLPPLGSTLPTFTFTSSVIDDVAGVSTGFVTGSQRTQVEAAALANFTLPSGAFLDVSSDVSGMAALGGGGTVQNHTTVNGSVVSSLDVGVNSSTDALAEGQVANTPSGYTLSSQVVYSGGTPGVTGLVISASSGVAMTPEPASMAVWGIGLVGLAVASLFPRHRRGIA